MKRMHVHVGVDDLAQSLRFYSALFGVAPVKVKDDYAKWMLEDPRLNFAISTRAAAGVNHLGLQVDDDTELAALRERLEAADLAVVNEGETVCCYAQSDKSWVTDPSGVPWEAYRSMADADVFSQAAAVATGGCAPAMDPSSPAAPTADRAVASACCGPKAAAKGCCP